MTFDTIVLWCVSVFISVGGYLAIVQPSEAAIAANATSNAMLASRIARTESVLHNEPNLKGIHKRVERDLAQIALNNREKDAMTFLLHTIAKDSIREHTVFISFSPASTQTTEPPAFTSRDISFSVRGSFHALLALLPRLSMDDPLLEIHAITIQTGSNSIHDTYGHRTTDLRIDITARLYHVLPRILNASFQGHERIHPQHASANIL